MRKKKANVIFKKYLVDIFTITMFLSIYINTYMSDIFFNPNPYLTFLNVANWHSEPFFTAEMLPTGHLNSGNLFLKKGNLLRYFEVI
jgi:hypothetical protein